MAANTVLRLTTPNPSSLLFPSPNTSSSFPNTPKSLIPFPKHIRIPILHGKHKRRRLQQRNALTRSMLYSAFTIASRLGLLPPPVETILREFGGGNGSGSGFGSGSGPGWGSDGWGRKRKGMKWGVFRMVVLGCGVGLMWMVLKEGKNVDVDMVLGGLGMVVLGASVEGLLGNGARDWVLGFCCCAVLMGLVFKREELKGLVAKLKKRKRGNKIFMKFI